MASNTIGDNSQLTRIRQPAISGAPDRVRTTHACNSCRLLKIRCIVSENVDVLSCENCEKSSKDCIFAPRTKTRRRKRADVRVTELEDEVRTLASLLQKTMDGRQSSSAKDLADVETSQDEFRIIEDSAVETLSVPATLSNSTSTGLESSTSTCRIVTKESVPSTSPMSNMAQRQITNSPLPQTWLAVTKDPPPMDFEQQDVITRGILSWSDALHLFRRYQSQLTPCYPIVPLVDNTDAAIFRREKPVLFLAVITAAAAVSHDQLRDTLHDEILRTYADCIMVQGKKSLELLQALLITVAWYRPCGSYNDTKYLHYTQAASLMAHELDLGTAESERRTQFTDWSTDFDVPSISLMDHNQETELVGTGNTERYRTLLASYVQSSTKYLMSHSPTVPPVTSQVTACLQALEATSNLTVLDRDFIVWARLQLLTQEARRSFERERSESRVRIEDNHVNLALCAFEKQLLTIMKTRPPRPSNACLEITYHANVLHLNEIALHEDYSPRDFHPPYSLKESAIETAFHAGAAYITAIMKCISSSHLLLDTFLASDAAILSAAPSMIFVRMTYAATILLKIFLLVNTTKHPLAAVLDRDQLQLPRYLKGLETLLTSLEHNLSFHNANKYLDIILRLQRRYESHQIQNQTVNQDLTHNDYPREVTRPENELVIPYNTIHGYWHPQHPDSFMHLPNSTASRTNHLPRSATIEEMYMEGRFPSDVFAEQELPFSLQGMEGLLWDS